MSNFALLVYRAVVLAPLIFMGSFFHAVAVAVGDRHTVEQLLALYEGRRNDKKIHKEYERKYNDRLSNLIDYLDDERVTLVFGDKNLIRERTIKTENGRVIFPGDNLRIKELYVEIKNIPDRK